METTKRRDLITAFFERALTAVDPDPLTTQALAGSRGPVTLVAIGKAAAGMCRGAARALGQVEGICVTAAESPVPPGIEMIVGDHPVPGESSFHAGRRVIEVITSARHPIVALISGGGSALCEHPIDGVSPDLIREATSRLLDSGAPIETLNMVRSHLSAVKGGGLARVASQPIETIALSDVCGADPSVIASGPTSSVPVDPDAVLEVLTALGMDLPDQARRAIARATPARDTTPVRVIADGHTAMDAAADAARSAGFVATTMPGWLHGAAEAALDDFFENAIGDGLTFATGEIEVEVTGAGVGGRNTHVALMAAQRLSGSDGIFAALATDGVDGRSGGAGAVVDGETLGRGGDPRSAFATSNTARYLQQSGDLVVSSATGTNVGDLWMLWP